jgi:hypothetical protein
MTQATEVVKPLERETLRVGLIFEMPTARWSEEEVLLAGSMMMELHPEQSSCQLQALFFAPVGPLLDFGAHLSWILLA